MQVFHHGLTKLNFATNGDQMVVVLVNAGQGSHVSCVLMLGETPSFTEMIQIVEAVAVECNGALFPLMQKHGLEVSKYVIAGMQMEMEDSVVGEHQGQYVLMLVVSLKSTGMIQTQEVVDVECHGCCPFLVLHHHG